MSQENYLSKTTLQNSISQAFSSHYGNEPTNIQYYFHQTPLVTIPHEYNFSTISINKMSQELNALIYPKLLNGPIYYSLACSTLKIHRYYQLEDALDLIEDIIKEHPEETHTLQTFQKNLNILKEINLNSTASSNEKIQKYALSHNFVTDFLSYLTDTSIKTQTPDADTDLIPASNPRTYLSQRVVITNINQHVSDTDQTQTQILKRYNINKQVLIAFIQMLPFTLKDFKINDDELYFTPHFVDRLDQYLIHRKDALYD